MTEHRSVMRRIAHGYSSMRSGPLVVPAGAIPVGQAGLPEKPVRSVDQQGKVAIVQRHVIAGDRIVAAELSA